MTKQAEKMLGCGYLAASEAARRLGVAPTTIYRWVDEGFVKAESIGKHRYLLVSSLVAHVGPAGARLLGIVKKEP